MSMDFRYMGLLLGVQRVLSFAIYCTTRDGLYEPADETSIIPERRKMSTRLRAQTDGKKRPTSKKLYSAREAPPAGLSAGLVRAHPGAGASLDGSRPRAGPAPRAGLRAPRVP